MIYQKLFVKISLVFQENTKNRRNHVFGGCNGGKAGFKFFNSQFLKTKIIKLLSYKYITIQSDKNHSSVQHTFFREKYLG